MLKHSILEKYDSQKMYKVYERWPEIAQESWESNIESLKLENVNHIVFGGMGGSGSIGDLFNAVFSKTSIHIP